MEQDKKIKVLLGPSTFGELDAAPLTLLKEMGYEVIPNPYRRKLSKTELLDLLAGDVSGIIAGLEPLDREVLEKTNLKVISRCGSGMSNVDLETAKKLNIEACFTPHGPTTAVAELTLGAMLSLLRMIPQMDHDLHEEKWKKKIGRQLQGKTVVIVGFGRIGQKVASLLGSLNVKIIAVDPNIKEDFKGIKFLSLNEALTQADIITIHSSGEDEILGKKEFGLMKEGVFLLNAARGKAIDEQALIEALDTGKISGAWIDTFCSEPYKGPLSKYRQVILTPHVGSYTIEGRKCMEMDAANNLISAFKRMGQDA